MDEVIVRNAVKCRRCGDVIESRKRHDFAVCSCGSVAVDGGRDYLRRCGDPADYEEMSEVRDDNVEVGAR